MFRSDILTDLTVSTIQNFGDLSGPGQVDPLLLSTMPCFSLLPQLKRQLPGRTT